MSTNQNKRSRSNIFLAFLYYMCALFFPILLVMIRLDEIAHGQSWYMFTVGLSSLFLFIGGIAIIVELFPKTNKKTILLFVFLVSNITIAWLTSKNHTSEYNWDILFVNGIVMCTSFVLGFLLSILIDSWYDEEAAEKGKHVSLNSIKKKMLYIKKQPGIIVGFIILLIPVIFIAHLSLIGLQLYTNISIATKPLATAIYAFMISSASFANYKEFKQLNVTDDK